MKKTSVYLPDDLKAALSEASERAGCSEAEFIRLAIDVATQQSAKGMPAPEQPRQRPAGPALVGVGVGPGPADLLTARAIHEVRSADTIAAASISAQAIGRAEAVMRAGVGPVRVLRLALDVSGSPEARACSLAAAAERLVERLDRREVVAFLTLGDPNLFSVFPALAAAVLRARPGVPVRTVPGVLAFQELAARSGTVVVAERGSLRIVARGGEAETDNDTTTAHTATSGAEDEVGDSIGRAEETLVLYRGGRAVPSIARALAAAGRADNAVVGELLGLPGERWSAAAEFLDDAPSYLATLIAPAPGRR